MKHYLVWLVVSTCVLAEGTSPWTRHEIGGGRIHDIQLDPSDSSRRLVSGSGPAPFVTTDDGQHWRAVEPPELPQGGTSYLGGRGILWKGKELPYEVFSGPFVSPDGRVFVGCGGTVYSRTLPK